MRDGENQLEKAERRRVESELFLLGNHLRKRRETKQSLERELSGIVEREKRLAVDKKRVESKLQSIAHDLRAAEDEERSLKRKLQSRTI